MKMEEDEKAKNIEMKMDNVFAPGRKGNNEDEVLNRGSTGDVDTFLEKVALKRKLVVVVVVVVDVYENGIVWRSAARRRRETRANPITGFTLTWEDEIFR